MTVSQSNMSLRSSLKSTIIVAFISCLAGIVMLMQDVILASHFAASAAADAYQFAISFPMLALNVFAGGTILAVLVPLLVQFDAAEQKAEAAFLRRKVLLAMAWMLLAICVMWMLVYPQVAGQFAKAFSADTQALSERLLWITIPVLLFSGLASVDAAVLNSRRHFVFISTLPAFMPAGVILCVLLLENRLGIYSAAIGLFCGSAMQLLICHRLTVPLLYHVKHSPAVPLSLSRFMRNYWSAAASAALLGGIPMTGIFMASTLTVGSTATYSYASRPVMLLLAFATAVVGNVTLPFFSHLVALGDWRSLKKQILFWYSMLAIGVLPIVIFWYFHTDAIVALLYQRGAFGASDTVRVAAVQQIYLLQIPFFLVAMIGWRAMNSLNRNLALLVITATCFTANLVAVLWLAPHLGLQGVAWGADLAFALWAILITLYLLKICNSNAVLAPNVLEKDPLPLARAT